MCRKIEKYQEILMKLMMLNDTFMVLSEIIFFKGLLSQIEHFSRARMRLYARFFLIY